MYWPHFLVRNSASEARQAEGLPMWASGVGSVGMWSSWASCELVHISMLTPYLSIMLNWSYAGTRMCLALIFALNEPKTESWKRALCLDNLVYPMECTEERVLVHQIGGVLGKLGIVQRDTGSPRRDCQVK